MPCTNSIGLRSWILGVVGRQLMLLLVMNFVLLWLYVLGHCLVETYEHQVVKLNSETLFNSLRIQILESSMDDFYFLYLTD